MQIATSLPLVDVVDSKEVKEAWTCPYMSSDTGGPGDEHFRAGTVVRIDGAAHRARRRAMQELLSRGGHRYFRDTALRPTAQAAMEQLLANPDPDGYARVDLVPHARRVSQQLASALAGLDGAVGAEGAAELHVLLQDYVAGKQGAFDNTFHAFDEEAPLAKKSVAAKEQIAQRFLRPAYERRVALAEDFRAGRIAKEDLPSDLLMLMALRNDPAWEDAALRERETIFVLGAGVRTSAASLAWAVAELFEWLDKHPEDRALLGDDEFMFHVANEALRLHPVTPGFIRRATQDVDLQKGTHVADGQLIAIRNGPAGVDPELYGEDAAEFNPHRVLGRGVQPHGYAFGAGPHMCYGAPIVMGNEGVDGSLVYLLKVIMTAGAERDPDQPRVELEGTRGVYSDQDKFCYIRFPVAVAKSE